MCCVSSFWILRVRNDPQRQTLLLNESYLYIFIIFVNVLGELLHELSNDGAREVFMSSFVENVILPKMMRCAQVYNIVMIYKWKIIFQFYKVCKFSFSQNINLILI